MAIAGLLVHALEKDLEDLESRIRAMDGMTTYGIHHKQFIVVVAESPMRKMEDLLDGLKDLEGVLTIYTTYATVEDEVDSALNG